MHNQLTLQYAIALMGYADELETTTIELTYNHGVTQHSKGNGYSRVTIGTDDVYKSAEIVNLITEELGGKITQPPSLDSQMNSKIISFLDSDGWQIKKRLTWTELEYLRMETDFLCLRFEEGDDEGIIRIWMCGLDSEVALKARDRRILIGFIINVLRMAERERK
ncbi:lactoylglutathione lyase-like [Cucumis melo var. makuwa]|uniref:Lactoylglutathione lyase-like n=1 Tax=Cucumis melo var. makuwa TaxID=1194695 RepID=A0A5D3C9V2_CUCMM|nr:lactoylglutathione lyase-like [Cucumis melo var. makuwa]TYK08082.1 lactoylglutathione lyase-like [Cucumis melo var. makuwa]